MKTMKTKLSSLKSSYHIKSNYSLNETLFLDIETTGFSATTSSLYMIGCVYFDHDHFQLIQWFAQKPSEEKSILQEFLLFCKNFKQVIHFNGNRFDVPYLLQKASYYELSETLSSLEAIDLYKRILPCKQMLKLPDCKQKTIEIFLNVSREDTFSGGELIRVYQAYVANPDQELFEQLIQHNADDLAGLVSLLPILAYCELFLSPIRVKKVQANYYRDYQGEKKQELLMKLELPSPLPVAISYGQFECYFTGKDQEGTLKIPILEDELKYFYSNYKDYYYLPIEDMALHKSVASFVSKDHRIPATARNCYTRKRSQYLPQWEALFEPFFKRNYDDSAYFFELTEELKQHRDAFSIYASHIMQMFLKHS